MRTHLTHKEVDLEIEYEILNDSFDHQFGTERLPDYVHIIDIFVSKVSIILLISEDELSIIERLIDL